MTPELSANLEALARVAPDLAQRLCLPVDGSHVRLREGQVPGYKVHRYFYPFMVGVDALERSVAHVDGARDVVVFGIGLGEQLDEVLVRSPLRCVTVWDRDPWLMRLVLARRDYSDLLADGRLALTMGSDLMDLAGDVGDRHLVTHPFLDAVYRFERRLLDDGMPERCVLLRAGTLFIDDLAAELAERGYGIYTLDTERLSREEIELTVRRFAPSFIAAVNYTGGLAELCHALDVPLMCWEIDPSTTAVQPTRAPTDNSHIFTYRRPHVDQFRSAGFANVRHLPLATNEQRRAPLALSAEERDEYGAPVSFVGASMVAEALDFRQRFLERYVAYLEAGGEGTLEQAGANLAEILKVQRLDYTTFRLPALLQEHFAPFLAAARSDVGAEDPLMWVSEMAASEKRLTYVANLGAFGVVAWGDAGWKQIEPYGARYSGRYARHTDELTRVYCASTINVDIGRLYQSDIVTMRVFDVLACGGFLLAEHSDDLGELFEVGLEVESYANLDELKRKVAFYLANPEAARAIADRGRTAVRTRHTIRQRVETMLESMGL
jgi:hypothetical protein